MVYIPELLLFVLTIVQISIPSVHSTIAFCASLLLFAVKSITIKKYNEELTILHKEIRDIKDKLASLSFKR